MQLTQSAACAAQDPTDAHQDELDSLLEALRRGVDMMVPGPRRAAASNVAERLRNLHRELSLRAVARAGSA
jgi:beta-glucosidase-like glycosyl hydrolase